MKKIRNIGLILGLIILISSNSNAQYFYTSYGYAQNWHLPGYIEYAVNDNYFGYDIAHVQRYTRYGHTNFKVLLHRNGWFVELRFDRHGHIYRTIRHSYYPLMSHRCTNHCGYHHAYYQTYYPTYHHKHYVHKHRKTVYVNTHNGHGKKHHNNYYTNVHVEKQQKNQNHYRSNHQANRQTQNSVNNRTSSSQHRSNSVIRQPRQSNRQTQNNVISRTNNHQQRSNSAIRKPQQTNRNVQHARPQQNGNSKRAQYINPQRASSRSSNSTSAKRLTTYKNERGTRNR